MSGSVVRGVSAKWSRSSSLRSDKLLSSHRWGALWEVCMLRCGWRFESDPT